MVPKNYQEHLEFFRSRHQTKKYYTTTEIIKITGVCERTVRSRIAKLKIKYEGQERFMYKENKQWYINQVIVDEFSSKYRPRKKTRYNTKWESFISWVMRDSYDDDAHNFLIHQVKKSFPTQDYHNDWFFVIEKTQRGINHVHGLSLLSHEELFRDIYQVIQNNGISETEYDVLVGQIENRHCSERYLRK